MHYLAGSVVQTDIHHPTDSTLLWDVVRVVTRLVGRLKKAVQKRVRGFHNRKRVARRRMQEIQRMKSTERHERQTKKYRELIGVTEEVVTGARKVVEQTKKARSKDLAAEMAIPELRKEIEHYCKLGDRVIDQARRRVLEGEQVPNAEKIYSIFEAHTDLIKRGKVQTPLEFGHKVFLAESAQGLMNGKTSEMWSHWENAHENELSRHTTPHLSIASGRSRHTVANLLKHGGSDAYDSFPKDLSQIFSVATLGSDCERL